MSKTQNRINNIIILSKDGKPETWSSLKKLCEEYKFPYWTLSRKKFPFEYKEYKFNKTKIK